MGAPVITPPPGVTMADYVIDRTEWLMSFGWNAQKIMRAIGYRHEGSFKALLRRYGRHDLIARLWPPDPYPDLSWVRKYAKKHGLV